MRQARSVKWLEDLGRKRLSSSFFMRDFLYSEIANAHGIPNIPEDPDLLLHVGRNLCETLLEPLQAKFGRLAIRSAYRSPDVNAFGNEKNLNCASNTSNFAGHIWDIRDADGYAGGTVCLAIPWALDNLPGDDGWQQLAWWMHDHLDYSQIVFFPKLWAFNIQWHENPKRIIRSYIPPKGIFTAPDRDNFEGDHSAFYPDISS